MTTTEASPDTNRLNGMSWLTDNPSLLGADEIHIDRVGLSFVMPSMALLLTAGDSLTDPVFFVIDDEALTVYVQGSADFGHVAARFTVPDEAADGVRDRIVDPADDYITRLSRDQVQSEAI